MIETLTSTIYKAQDKTGCDTCGKECTSQIYQVHQIRPTLTRTWNFCSMSHMRQWSSAPR